MFFVWLEAFELLQATYRKRIQIQATRAIIVELTYPQAEEFDGDWAVSRKTASGE